MNNKLNPIIISLGGSLVIPKKTEKINVEYLLEFKKLIESHTKQGKRFFIIVGGGNTAREYQNAGNALFDSNHYDLDMLGIYVTHLNAHLVQMLFNEISYPHIIKDPTLEYQDISNYPISIAGGWKPGNSTDYIAVMLAQKYNVKSIINLSNIDYIYDKDPYKNPDAKPIKEISWTKFRDMVGNKWDPGASAPFDPIASIESDKLNLEVAILNGENLDNLDAYLNQEESIFSLIK